MKFQYLGTAAAEGWPALFCRCEKCMEALKRGGKDIRTRSQAMVNDDLLIDLPPDTYLHKLQHGLELSKVRDLLITHWHMDHFFARELCNHGGCYSHDMIEPELHVHCAQGTLDTFLADTGWTMKTCEERAIVWHILKPYESFTAGRYTVTPLPAKHMLEMKNGEPYFYLIEEGEKSVLYCHDTGIFYDEVWEFLAKREKPLSMLSVDGTYGPAAAGYGGHMGLPENIIVRDRLKEIGLVDENTVCVINHFSHNGGMAHDEFSALAGKEGFLVSYDGMKLEI